MKKDNMMKNRVDKVVCPLGVGEHFEYWGFEKSSLVELVGADPAQHEEKSGQKTGARI